MSEGPGRGTGIAIIGCGLIGTKRAEALPPGAWVASVFDLDPTRAEALAATVDGDPVVTGSLDEALSADGAGLAVVATVHKDLAATSIAAIQRGRDVLVEKPGARSAAELAEVAAAAGAEGRTVRVGFNHRFHPAIVKATELIAAGDWGDLMSVRGRYGHGGRVGYEAEWRMNREISGGGELMDQGVHLIDLTRHLVGDVELVFSELRTDFWVTEVEDNAFLALRPRAGGFAWLHASWTEWINLFSLEIAFRTAKLELTGLGGSYGTERLVLAEMAPEMGRPPMKEWEFPEPDSSWRAEMEDVLEAIHGRPAVGASIDDALAVLRITDDAYAR